VSEYLRVAVSYRSEEDSVREQEESALGTGTSR